jgi:hypothetical protein
VHAGDEDTVRFMRALIAGEYCGEDGCRACKAKVEAVERIVAASTPHIINRI